MANVGDRIAALNAQQPALSQELKEFLDIVWSHRVAQATRTTARHESADQVDVYNLYARISTHRVGLHQVRPFLQGLLTLPQLPEIQCVPTDDPDVDVLGNRLWEEYEATPAPSGFAQLAPDHFAELVADAQHDDDLARRLGDTFFHFRRARSHCSDRIYLHVQPLQMLAVMREVVTTLVRDPVRHPGVSNAKVGVPGGFERADSIVIYLNDAAAQRQALDAIAAYQRQGDNRARFAPGHTRGTQGIDQHNGVALVGVSVGAEPPMDVVLRRHGHDFSLRPGVSSFGTFRATLIKCALVRTMAHGEDKAQFVRRTLDYFQRSGIDPRLPHQHGLPPQARARARALVRQVRQGLDP